MAWDRLLSLEVGSKRSDILCKKFMLPRLLLNFFFFNDTATTEIYTSLHDALPICAATSRRWPDQSLPARRVFTTQRWLSCEDRKSTRLNSSHVEISYAVFCLKKKTRYSVLRLSSQANE